jgi:hypothetical protein
MIFFHTAHWPQTTGGRAQPAGEKFLGNDKAAGVWPARLRCRARRHRAYGAFSPLPVDRKEQKQTQPVSLAEKAGSVPARAPMPPHMGQFVLKSKGRYVALQQNAPASDDKGPLALPGSRHYQRRKPVLGNSDERRVEGT